jgi:hypothetical protein
MELLYLAKSKEDVFRGDRVRERAVTTVVNERDGKLLDALWATVVVGRCQASDIKEPYSAGTSKSFFVTRAGQLDDPPHDRHAGA